MRTVSIWALVVVLSGCGKHYGSNADGGEPGDQPDLSSTTDLAGPTVTTLRVFYPVGTHTMALRCGDAPLNWTKGVTLKAAADGAFEYVWPALTAPTACKPLLDDTTWAHGANYVIQPNTTVEIYPHFVSTHGQVKQLYASFHSTVMTFDQPVWVYLPASYDENTLAHYPVAYMQDGQNLFDPALAFLHNEWKVDEALDAASEGDPAPTAIREIIVVAPEAGPGRNDNYTPTRDASEGFGGNGDKYLQMLVQELKPAVDSTLRTLPARDTTGILGSSLGGLISAWAGCTHADTFGLIGALSPSTWWDNETLIAKVGAMGQPRPLRVYLDSGDSGPSNDDVDQTTRLAAAYTTLGYDDTDLLHVVQAGGQHSEIYWAQRIPGGLQFLFGKR